MPTTCSGSPLRLLGVYAHPDDETFCAGGVLAKFAAAGAELMIVSATQGEAGQIRDGYAATRRTLGPTRVAELHQACERLGVQHVQCLNYGDGKLDAQDPALLADVTQIIRTFRPDIVLTFGDDGAYGHPDHIAIGAVTDAAYHLSGDPEHCPRQVAAGLSPYSPTRLYHSYFPRRPHLLLTQLAGWLTNLNDRFCGTSDFIHSLMLLANETSILGHSSDHVDICWYPPNFSIIEQDEPPTSLYFILSGEAEVIHETADGQLHHRAILRPGSFFGEEGLAYRQPRNAHVIARTSLTCLVLAPQAPTAFAGRGQQTDGVLTGTSDQLVACPTAMTDVNISAYVGHKIKAIVAHRTQYPIAPELLPESILQDLFAHEYFICIDSPQGEHHGNRLDYFCPTSA